MLNKINVRRGGVLLLVLSAMMILQAQTTVSVSQDEGLNTLKDWRAAYLEHRERVWMLNPPITDPSNAPIRLSGSRTNWYVEMWDAWLSKPGWFVEHRGSASMLSPRLTATLWPKGEQGSVLIWEHPGEQKLYIGREDVKTGELTILISNISPDWEILEHESAEAFYKREVATRRVVWRFPSPYAPDPVFTPEIAPFQTFAMMMASAAFTVQWTDTQNPQAMGMEVDFSTATEAGPFAVWKNTVGITIGPNNGWEDLSGDWRPIAWVRQRPTDPNWTGTLNVTNDDQLFLRASLGIIDSDNDGLDDGFEFWFFGDLDETASGDYDVDGFTNLQEFDQNSNPAIADSDLDGRKDGDESTLGTNPSWPDHPDVELEVTIVR